MNRHASVATSSICDRLLAGLAREGTALQRFSKSSAWRCTNARWSNAARCALRGQRCSALITSKPWCGLDRNTPDSRCACCAVIPRGSIRCHLHPRWAELRAGSRGAAMETRRRQRAPTAGDASRFPAVALARPALLALRARRCELVAAMWSVDMTPRSAPSRPRPHHRSLPARRRHPGPTPCVAAVGRPRRPRRRGCSWRLSTACTQSGGGDIARCAPDRRQSTSRLPARIDLASVWLLGAMLVLAARDAARDRVPR